MQLLVVSINDNEAAIIEDIIDYLSRKYGSHPISLKIEQDDLLIDSHTRIVENKNGSIYSLTAKEFDLLYYLFTNRSQVFTKKQLYDQVWGYNTNLDLRNLSSFI